MASGLFEFTRMSSFLDQVSNQVEANSKVVSFYELEINDI